MELFDLLELAHLPLKDEWRFAIAINGALSVMTHGTVWMLVLLVFNLAIVTKVINYSCKIPTIIYYSNDT